MTEPIRTEGRAEARRASAPRRRPPAATLAPRRNPTPEARPASRGRPRPTRVAAPFGALLLGRPPVATVTVGRHESSEHVFRRLLGAYLGGAREFIVVDRHPRGGATRDVVRTFCRRTRQPEIVSEEEGVLRLRDLAYESPVPLPERLGRMGRMVVGVHREAVESWAHLPFGDDRYWERRDDEIDREAWYVQRLAALHLGLDGPGVNLLGPWTIARSLERIADHATVLGEYGRRLVELPDGAGPLTSLKQFHSQAMEHLEGVLAARDDAEANDLLDVGDALLASGRALSDRLLPAVGGGTMPPATAAAVTRILESIGRTIAYAQDIAQVTLDRAIPMSFADAPATDGAPIPL
ncbi:MAG TPA: PhoU domain-containing protein [Thermoplasmata archaeon]|nr:PhoU domain-containing protein [Thermoplasmata archaeon]